MSTPPIAAAATSGGSFESESPAVHLLKAALRPRVEGHARPDVLLVDQTTDGSMSLEPALAYLWSSRQPLLPERERRRGIADVVSIAAAAKRLLQDAGAMTHAY